jgi:cytoskeleton protein RodZ
MSLEALERSDLSRLPGGIFTRAFIRAYAEEVGLDPDRTMHDFIAELPPEAATATAHSAVVEDGEQLESDRRAVATGARLALVSLPIIALVVFYGTRGIPEAWRSPVEQPTARPAASGLTLEIAPRASCWVSVTADGEATFSGVMSGGETRVVTAREQITFNVGDAGAFAFSLNGRAGRPLGAPGEVVSGRITLANLNDFLAP